MYLSNNLSFGQRMSPIWVPCQFVLQGFESYSWLMNLQYGCLVLAQCSCLGIAFLLLMLPSSWKGPVLIFSTSSLKMLWSWNVLQTFTTLTALMKRKMVIEMRLIRLSITCLLTKVIEIRLIMVSVCLDALYRGIINGKQA